jgi:tetratricopeptide (TPR) repeat protein
MKYTYCFTKRAPVYLIALIFLLTACATQQPAQQADSTLPSAQVEAAEPSAAVEPTDPDVLYRVLAGEVIGADGDSSDAAYEYLEAAMESEDPAIAARATRIAMAAQEWQYAAMAADRWALLQPENIDARQIAARAMMVVGDYVGAEHQFKAMIETMAHDRSRAWALTADLLSSAANPEKARQLMDRLALEYGGENSGDALFAQSILLGRQGMMREALQTAERALKADPERANIHAWAGRLAVNLEREAEALEHYHTAWDLRPQDRRIAMAYAELLRRNERPDEAQAVLSGLDDTPDMRFARIAFALDSEYRELAEELYAEFGTAQYPDPLEHAFQAAQAAELLGWPQQAIAWYARIDQGERLLVATLRGAFLTAEAGDVPGARSMLAELRREQDRSFAADSLLAETEILSNAGMESEAFELLSGALGEHQPDTRLLYSRAILAVQLDRLATAEQDLRKIIELEPRNATALNALGYTLADLTDRYAEAEQLIFAAYELQPEEASIIDSMGWVAYRQGNLPEAKRYLHKAWERERNPEIGAHLGEVLWVAGEQEAARAIWEEALGVDPDNEALRETLARFGISP